MIISDRRNSVVMWRMGTSFRSLLFQIRMQTVYGLPGTPGLGRKKKKKKRGRNEFANVNICIHERKEKKKKSKPGWIETAQINIKSEHWLKRKILHEFTTLLRYFEFGLYFSSLNQQLWSWKVFIVFAVKHQFRVSLCSFIAVLIFHISIAIVIEFLTYRCIQTVNQLIVLMTW